MQVGELLGDRALDKLKLPRTGSVQLRHLAEMIVDALDGQLAHHRGDDLDRVIEIDPAPLGGELQARIPFRGHCLAGDRRERWRFRRWRDVEGGGLAGLESGQCQGERRIFNKVVCLSDSRVGCSDWRVTVRPRGDALGEAAACWDHEFGNHSARRDAPDLVAQKLGEPQRAVRPLRKVEWGAAERRDREFGRHAGGGDGPDLVGLSFREPQRAVRTAGDVVRTAVGCGNREFAKRSPPTRARPRLRPPTKARPPQAANVDIASACVSPPCFVREVKIPMRFARCVK